IVFSILSLAGAVISLCFVITAEKKALPIILMIVLLILGIGLILLITLSLNKKIQNFDEPLKKLKKEIDELIALATKQMAPLNALYDYEMPADVFNRSIDDFIVMDRLFDVKKYQYLVGKFGLIPNKDKDVSVMFVKSGNVLGNPFLLYKTHNMRMIQKTYTGTKTITWTTTIHTKEGTQRVTHSETLVATVTQPAPSYSYITHLVYGNDAAPNLSFSRKPSGMSGEEEKAIDKVVNKKTKELDKKARKELTDNDPTTNYTRFSNDEFEVLFGGLDRDNEIEYRLLFTPLAIKNELDLIKNDEPYGDDFYFEKFKKVNVITSRHSQSFNYKADPELFINISYEEAKRIFVSYCNSYFRGFYFDLAPLISIPLYQQNMTEEFIYNEEFESNYTSYEHEYIANEFGWSAFAHPNTTTDSILKTEFSQKDDVSDRVLVNAYSFKGEPRVTYIKKMGGDGHMHSIPVDWVEYIPLENSKEMEVAYVSGTRKEYNEIKGNADFNKLLEPLTSRSIYRKGLFASILEHPAVQNNFNNISKYFKEMYNNSSVKNNSNNNINSNINVNNLNNAQTIEDEVNKIIDKIKPEDK
nr:hypothetical protein [Gammaproteobacteria bacterium]